VLLRGALQGRHRVHSVRPNEVLDVYYIRDERLARLLTPVLQGQSRDSPAASLACKYLNLNEIFLLSRSSFVTVFSDLMRLISMS
jgi:hypothetical protein